MQSLARYIFLFIKYISKYLRPLSHKVERSEND